MIRSMEDQLRDIRSQSESGWAVVHIDTCLSCYLQDHHNRDGELLLGVPVNGESTVGEVLDELASELQQFGDLAADRAGFDWTKAEETIKALQAENVDRAEMKFDNGLETLEEDDYDEPVQAWFLLTWEVPEEES